MVAGSWDVAEGLVDGLERGGWELWQRRRA